MTNYLVYVYYFNDFDFHKAASHLGLKEQISAVVRFLHLSGFFVVSLFRGIDLSVLPMRSSCWGRESWFVFLSCGCLSSVSLPCGAWIELWPVFVAFPSHAHLLCKIILFS